MISLGEALDDNTNYRIDIIADKNERTITVTDNGIGMNKEEVDRYINNIALSGAVEFISKYEGDNANGIIGHFGLGFYSMFIIAKKVEMFTRSFKGGDGVHWFCDSDGNFESEPCDREGHGTQIIMHLSEDELEYLEQDKLQSILERYCAFMPYEIALHDENSENIINETTPLWQKKPQDVSNEEYNKFYKKLFNDFDDPLFRVHIVADYPLNFKCILYIPKRKNGYDSTENEIKLFYNSVFVADNIKEACPEFLVNIKGVLDCPELPLNVSRSYLQNDAYMRKISAHISKKVSDRLLFLFNNERNELEKNWRHMKSYFEYACMRDEKFGKKIKDIILFETVNGKYVTISEHLGDKEESEILYTTNKTEQSYYIHLFESKGIECLVFDTILDSSFAQYLESKNEKIKFRRIDSGFNETKLEANESITNLFKSAIGRDELEISYISLGEDGAAAIISIPEEGRRFADMMKMYNLSSGNEDFKMPNSEKLMINVDNPIIKKLEVCKDESKAEDVAKHVYLSAVLLSRTLTADEAKEYVRLNNKLI